MLTNFLVVLTILIVVGSTFMLARYISLTEKANQAREDRTLRRVEHLVKDNHRVYSLVIDRQIMLDDKMDEYTKNLMDFNTFVNLQLLKLQKLVQFDMTTARQDELIRTKELKAALERLISITTLSRQPPIGSDILAIEAAMNRIKELEHILSYREEYHD